MTMSTILDARGEPIRKVTAPNGSEIAQLRRELNQWRTGQIRARYDSAQTSQTNVSHWANADLLSPDAANDHPIRRRLRSRSRYEVLENNSYLRGMAITMANDFTGSGPRMSVVDQSLSDAQRRLIETRFNKWQKETKLRQLVWRLRIARLVDGESFAIATTNPRLRDPVKLCWVSVEADQISTYHAYNMIPEDNEIDGIRFDENHIPTAYHLLNQHPGSISWWGGKELGGRWIPSHLVLHWLRQERPWLRGIPETVAALPLCSILRRYTLAVLLAAETAADFAAVMKTAGPPLPSQFTGAAEGSEYEAFDTFPIDKGMVTTLPYGYDLTQLRPEQPTTVYDAFVDSILKEISRALQMPFNIATGYSGGYNFASGTLDWQLYQGAIDADRNHLEDYVLSQAFELWWAEAIRIPDYLGQIDFRTPPPEIYWRWDRKPEHADPSKVASAIVTLWKEGIITDDQIQMERFNRDLDEYYNALEEQKRRRTEAGAPGGEAPVPSPSEPPPDTNQEDPQAAEAAKFLEACSERGMDPEDVLDLLSSIRG